MNKKVPPITESVEELNTLIKKSKDSTEKDKLCMLYQLKSGKAKYRSDVGSNLNISRITIGKWLSKYEEGGLQQLLERRYPPGRQSFLSPSQLKTLEEKLNDPKGFSSYVEIHRFITETFGVKISYSGVYALVRGKWGAKLKVPRKSHIKKNAAEADEFVKNLSSEVSAAISEKRSDHQRVRIFCQDESRYGTLQNTYRCITAPGIKPIATVDYTYEATYLYGAVEPLTGDRCFLEFPYLNTACFQKFVDHLSETFADTLNVVILDNGRFHHAKALKIPENVILVFLPPYCPELNPIERLWQDIKAKLFSPTYQTLKQMQENITQILLGYSNADISSITGFPYIIKTVNEI